MKQTLTCIQNMSTIRQTPIKHKIEIIVTITSLILRL